MNKSLEPPVNKDLAREHGLSDEEYDKVVSYLGRTPTYTELGIYSVMWSEHCSYKNSISMLKTLPREGGRLLVGAGEENAGLVDIGDDLAVAFKIESHNHPSAVEPYQGAATGVGGIMRDIFTMGARPIAALNSLRFGTLDNARARYLFKQVVKGIGDYGNSFGVPTVAGEVYFDSCYAGNPLVNAMAVGVVDRRHVASAVASGEGNSVIIVGSSTGRDGIHGATFASEELSEESEARRPSVQVGDPFTEKLLLEATLEAVRTGHVVGIQDMGAAGITCSSTEMSAKGQMGMTINLDSVPLRETGMSSYEIMLSESQERMLLVVKKGHEQDIAKIFDKWDLPAVVIGAVEGSNMVSVHHNGELKARVPAHSLVLGGGAPVYTREAKEPAYLKETRGFNPQTIPQPTDLTSILMKLLQRHSIASKRWVTDQYDSMVRTNSVLSFGGDAAVIRIKDTKKALAVKTDCNGRYVYLNPRVGGQIAVAEAARNVACVGATPVAITNCLNFGNPYDPEVYWQFREAVRGIGDACRAFDTPVTGGNVSFYNESPDGAVFPTPVIGMLGLLDDVDFAIDKSFKDPGDAIIQLGTLRGHIGGSEYLLMQSGGIHGDAPPLDLQHEHRLQQLLTKLASKRLIRSAHDVSEGGMAVALAECCFDANRAVGAAVRLLGDAERPDFYLFGEDQGVVFVSSTQGNAPDVLNAAKGLRIDAQVIGEVTAEPELRIAEVVNLDLAKAREAYESAIPLTMGD